MKIEVGNLEPLRAPSGGIRRGAKYPVVLDGVPGEVRVAYDARFRNAREQYSEGEIGQAIGRLVGLEKRKTELKPEFVLYLTTGNAASVGLPWQP